MRMEQCSVMDRAASVARDTENIIAEWARTKTVRSLGTSRAENETVAVIAISTERKIDVINATEEISRRIESLINAYAGKLILIKYTENKVEVTVKFKAERSIRTRIGDPALLEQLAEECAELSQAALKLARLYREENPVYKTEDECKAALDEEAADVLLCIGEMDGVLNKKRVRAIRDKKLERWHKSLDEREEEHDDHINVD